MLGNSGTASRPRPPAQMRRSSSMKTANSSPPPPYASSFIFPSNPRKSSVETRATLLGSPVSAALQMVAQDTQGSSSTSHGSPRNHGEMMDWLKEKSHDELSELLLRADEVIKQRETDLNRTSSLCKTLYEDNSSLQSKHKALLSRIPTTPLRRGSSDSPLPSPAPSTFTSSSHNRSPPNADSPIHSPAISRRSSDQDPFLYQAPRTVPHKYGSRHVRKISVTPYDISLLSDQNTELLLKVEKLEAESASNEITGKKMLKKMEKEITALRDELEAVRAKEAQNAETRAKEKAEAEFHRKEGKAKVRMMRSQSGPIHLPRRDSFGDDVRDFAPAGPLTSLFNRSVKHGPVHTPIRESTEEDDSSDSDALTPTTSASLEEQQRQFIAQVLTKMTELEEANARLESQQADTAARLQAIQLETESLGRVYEGIDDGVEIVPCEPSPEAEASTLEDPQTNKEIAGPPPPKHDNATIRFRSFRRTLEGLGAPPGLTEGGATISASSTSRMHTHKTRKSVMGLFEAPAEAPGSAPPRHAPVKSSNALETWANTSGLVSPALSTLSGFSSLSPNPFDLTSPPTAAGSSNTLSNELGGNEWPQDNGPSDHLRTSSLYDFNMLSGQADAAPSPSPSPVDFNRLGKTLFPPSNDRMETPRTPTRKDGALQLQLNLEPPTPESDTQKSPAAIRYRRMSQTVRARTARWVDGRFTDSVLGNPTGTLKGKRNAQQVLEEITLHEKEIVQSDTESVASTKTKKSTASASTSTSGSRPMPQRIASAFDSVVEKITGRSVSVSGSDKSRSNNPTPRNRAVSVDAIEVFVAPAPPVKEKKAASFGDIVLEVWLWLQFAVIILVFLWAMAKKGPKGVLQERQRASVHAS
ncbi:hypothetical protein VNI00_005763 [Paramarasmius palmivorus]|uniref:Uncharacterized protein n=1 Tax=Paramarasmius palmivorus TaxID=297713 RepID=A0AAW0DDK4_9AGAR